MTFLELKKIEAGYEKLQILHGVNIKINPNEITLIIGPNGAGKSTVLKSIFNLCSIYSGEIIYKGKNITKLPTHELIELGISIVPQGRQVFSNLTVKENLEMGAFLTREADLVKKRIKEVLTHFPDLEKKLNEPALNLSGGQQQMLAIGRALMQDPQLLLMDEPSLGLSPLLMKQLFKKIIEIKEEGCAILMIEQNAKQACQIADYIYVLENGQVALQGNKKILKTEKLKNIYLGGT